MEKRVDDQRKEISRQQAWWIDLFKNRRWESNFRSARGRCKYPSSGGYARYGGRGIKFGLTKDQVKFLWDRDNAKDMREPTLDRIDNDGNYVLENCRFMERKFNKTKRPYEWSMYGNCCFVCGTSERKHKTRGLCNACYSRDERRKKYTYEDGVIVRTKRIKEVENVGDK